MGDTPTRDGGDRSEENAKLELPPMTLPGLGRRKKRPAEAPTRPTRAPAPAAATVGQVPVTAQDDATQAAPRMAKPAAPAAGLEQTDPVAEPARTARDAEPARAAKPVQSAQDDEQTARLRLPHRPGLPRRPRRPEVPVPPAPEGTAADAAFAATLASGSARETARRPPAVQDSPAPVEAPATPATAVAVAGTTGGIPSIRRKFGRLVPVGSRSDEPLVDGAMSEMPGDQGPAPAREPFRWPVLPGWAAAAVTGLVVGVLGAGLTYLLLRGCEAVKGTESCGGTGVPLLLVVLVVMVLAGGALLGAWHVPEPRSTSFLGVGVLCVLALVALISALFSAWMFLALPVLGALAYVLAAWVTTAVVEPVPDRVTPYDVR